MAQVRQRHLIPYCRKYWSAVSSFWLDSPETAIKRVAQRVREGGHNIPQDVIVRRYHAGINNLFNLYMQQVDYWLLINNTQGDSEYVAEGGAEIPTEIFNARTYFKVKQYVRE